MRGGCDCEAHARTRCTTTTPPSPSPCDAGYTRVGFKCYKVVTSTANYLQVGFLHFYVDTVMVI